MTTSSAALQQRQFYLFVCSHSFLIGLFPFFLPVYLYKQGLSLSEICFFIAVSAITFTLGMWCWDRVKKILTPRAMLALCYLLELIMIYSIVICGPNLEAQHNQAYIIAAMYGLYQCFFWTTQRALFIQRSSTNNTGDRYGNFQVFVVVSLKIGVLIGGALLDQKNSFLLFIISLISVAIGFILVLRIPGTIDWPFRQWSVISIKKVITFKDNYRSKSIFALDGFFLFLESFFWLLSLFLILKQSFMQLGFMIIAITAALSLVFFILKKKIDQLPEQSVYIVSVIGYGASWIFRANLDETLSLFSQFIYLSLIAFLTALFRLAFNKRFYDLALHYPKTPYILMKSYYSQSALILFFGLFGFFHTGLMTADSLTNGYLIAALLTPIYFIYLTRKKQLSSNG